MKTRTGFEVVDNNGKAAGGDVIALVGDASSCRSALLRRACIRMLASRQTPLIFITHDMTVENLGALMVLSAAAIEAKGDGKDANSALRRAKRLLFSSSLHLLDGTVEQVNIDVIRPMLSSSPGIIYIDDLDAADADDPLAWAQQLAGKLNSVVIFSALSANLNGYAGHQIAAERQEGDQAESTLYLRYQKPEHAQIFSWRGVVGSSGVHIVAA